MSAGRDFNGLYRGEYLAKPAFPLGGIGAGMICLEGTGTFSHVSLRHKPEVFNEPYIYAAVCVKGAENVARVLEGQVPDWKVFGPAGTGNGLGNRTYGLPRFTGAEFLPRFPFATLNLTDENLPLSCELTGWSPFLPGTADDSSLPVAALEYKLINRSARPVEAVFSFHAKNFLAVGQTAEDKARQSVTRLPSGFALGQAALPDAPHQEAAFGVECSDPNARIDCGWFRGGWFDANTMVWRTVAAGESPARPPHETGEPSAGGSLYVPCKLAAGESRTITLRLSWYAPHSDLRVGKDPEEAPAPAGGGCACSCGKNPTKETYAPWYAGRFADLAAVAAYWREHFARLRAESAKFRDCFYDTTLPPEVTEAVAANLTILKSPTVLRQKDGRLWAWEGCCDGNGCCHGSCTHVWNYAQALPHLFPDLERSLRQTEFNESQDERGHQNFRANLPIRPTEHHFHAAADGQLGGIMKIYREWRVSGDLAWLRGLWPRVKQSLEYCIELWDPDRLGVLIEPHHNTYDIEFWGPDGMCASIYLGALEAAARMAEAVGDKNQNYRQLAAKGRSYVEEKLFNGEYFIQEVRWQGLRAQDPVAVAAQGCAGQNNYSPEALALMEKEGPKYQYGHGCLADGVIGDWLARACGLPGVLNVEQVRAHLRAVFEHNLKRDLRSHACTQRPTYGLGAEGALIACAWPRGRDLAIPFPYSDEVFTGIEYQVAAHLIMLGLVEPGLEVVRVCRERYDGRRRNPFNEYECGHWYARALASYSLLAALSGARYDAAEQTLYLAPARAGDFRCFLATATGYGTVGVKNGQPFLEVVHGQIPLAKLEYTPAA